MSAIYNILLIPAISIYFACDKNGNPVQEFEINRLAVYRDSIWLLTIEALFIYFFGFQIFTIGMAFALIGGYTLYVMHVIYDSRKAGDKGENYEFEALDHDEAPSLIRWVSKALDFNKILFGNKEYTAKSAWVVFVLSCTVIGIACHYLAEGTIALSNGFGIPVIIGAAVFAAAATSLPDTLLSKSAAQAGEYEDAVGNAAGSNIFDTSFAIGFPLIIAMFLGEWLYGRDLMGGIPIAHDGGFMDTVRYFVWVTSAIACIGLCVKAKRVTRNVAHTLVALYGLWVAYLVYMVANLPAQG